MHNLFNQPCVFLLVVGVAVSVIWSRRRMTSFVDLDIPVIDLDANGTFAGK